MKRLGLLAILPFLSGCSELYHWFFGASDQDIAHACATSVNELTRVREEVKALKPYQGRDLGKCTVMRGEGRRASVMLLESPPKAPSK